MQLKWQSARFACGRYRVRSPASPNLYLLQVLNFSYFCFYLYSLLVCFFDSYSSQFSSSPTITKSPPTHKTHMKNTSLVCVTEQILNSKTTRTRERVNSPSFATFFCPQKFSFQNCAPQSSQIKQKGVFAVTIEIPHNITYSQSYRSNAYVDKTKTCAVDPMACLNQDKILKRKKKERKKWLMH